ncbi:VTT domain-containing protein [bacterium]|nr:VTT domain-containing protein [bacterium]
MWIVLFILLLAGVLWGTHLFWWDVQSIIDHEDKIRQFVKQRPVEATFLGFVIHTLLCFVPGAGGKSLIMGWLFGFWSALIQVNVGLTIAAVSTFELSRYLFRDAVRRRLGTSLDRIDQAIAREGGYFLFALRLAHGPYTITNYTMGATSISIRSFWLATQFGMIPGNILFVYTGSQFPTLKQLSEQGVVSLLTWRVIGAFALVALLPIVIRRIKSGYGEVNKQ